MTRLALSLPLVNAFALSASGQPADAVPATSVETPEFVRSAVTPAIQRRLELLHVLAGTAATPGKSGAAGDLRSRASAEAKASVASQDVAGAEELLALANPFEPNGSDWELFAAQQLITVGQLLAQENNRSSAAGAAKRALQHLESARQQARNDGKTKIEAEAYSCAGWIYERFQGDPQAAIRSYQSALQLTPADAGAKESLDRLQRSLEILRERAGIKK